MPATSYPYGIGAPGLDQSVATSAITLPQTGNGTIFTVTGAPIQVISLFGIINTAIGAVANATKLQAVPTTAPTTAIDLCATLDLNAAAAGGALFLVTSFATAMSLVTSGVGPVASSTLMTTFFMRPGVIRVNTAGSDGLVGTISWYMTYRVFPNWTPTLPAGNTPFPNSTVVAIA